MTKATDGVLTHEFDHLLSDDVACYAHDGGLLVLYSPTKNVNIGIDPIGMTPIELTRAMMAGDTMLSRADVADPEPVNRKQRRAKRTIN